jgi:hypothetical protein
MTSWRNRQWWRAELWLAVALVVLLSASLVVFVALMY